MRAYTKVECSEPAFLVHSDDEKDSDDEQTWLLMDWTSKQWRPPKQGCLKSFFSHMCDPNYRPYRYIIAILLALLQGFLSYIIELPAGLQATIIRALKLDNTHYSVLFSAYSWADVVMSLVGTVIVNKYLGLHRGFVIFMVIVLLGQLMCAIGCYLGSFWIYLSGRLIFGCGNGTATSILSAFQVIWFGGKEIAFVMSLSRMMCRTFATFALATPQITYDALSPFFNSPFITLGTTQMVGTLYCIFGLCCVLGVVFLDKRGAKIIGRKSPKKNSNDSVHIFDIFSFPIAFWIIACSTSMVDGIIFVFTANSPLYFVSKYGLDLNMANVANSLSYTAVIPVTPVVSILIDFFGYNLIWGYTGIWFAIIPCLLYTVAGNFSMIPFIAAFFISLAFAVVGSAIWAAIGLVVKPHQITTAYGVAMSLLSLITALVGISGGAIIDHFGYFMMSFFNMTCLFLMSNLILALFISEIFSVKKHLNICGKSRRQKMT